MTRSAMVAAVVLAVSTPTALLGKTAPTPGYQEVAAVFNSTELSTAEKVARLKEMAARDETRWQALYHLDRLDHRAASDTALAMFRAADASRELKLRLGHLMLEQNRPQLEGFPQEFVKEFAAYLIGAVLDGGEAEFCRKLPGGTTTAVGEYAWLASDFGGYMNLDFAPFKDARVVPVLIACLDAPDDVIRGRPGESTGRNGARQQIPVALARLGDQRAVEPLKQMLLKHHDIYGQMNAAYALAKLLDKKEDRAAIGKELLARKELLWCRQRFGKGLIEIGDDNGVEFLAIRHAGGYGRLEYPSSILGMMTYRLNLLQGFKSPKVETFVREALSYKPWRAMVLFEPGSAKADRGGYFGKPAASDAEELQRQAPRIILTYQLLLACVELNNLRALSGDLEKIATETRNEKVREMTTACLKSLAENGGRKGSDP